MISRTGLEGAPVYALDGAALDELELLLGGLYAPADGYTLPGHTPLGWPRSFTLTVPLAVGKTALDHAALFVSDPDGTPLARLDITASHSTAKDISLAGTLTALCQAEHPPARNLRLTGPLPQTTAGPKLVAAFSSEPSPAQMAMVVSAAHLQHARLWLVAVCGPQQHGSYSAPGLLATLQECAVQLPDSAVGLLIVPDGPGHSASSHAIQNLGADILLDFTGAPQATGIRSPQKSALLPGSGQGAVVFLTGLSGSGKSTIARALADHLQTVDPRPLTLLDGDDVRRLLSSGLGFSKEDRETNIRRIGWVASRIALSGGVAICAPIAPYDAVRQEVRAMVNGAGVFVFVYISTPLSVCEQRDRKGLYALARAGFLPDFTGIDSPYEVPADADAVIDASRTSIEAAVSRISDVLALKAAAAGDRPLAEAASSAGAAGHLGEVTAHRTGKRPSTSERLSQHA